MPRHIFKGYVPHAAKPSGPTREQAVQTAMAILQSPLLWDVIFITLPPGANFGEIIREAKRRLGQAN
jgi:hypothetical protein